MNSEKIIYNKLVRDKIPQIIEKTGKKAEIAIYETNEFHEALAEKLLEEGKEYIESKNVEELADILEIIKKLLQLHGLSFKELEEIQNIKKIERGAFDKKIKLLSVS